MNSYKLRAKNFVIRFGQNPRGALRLFFHNRISFVEHLFQSKSYKPDACNLNYSSKDFNRQLVAQILSHADLGHLSAEKVAILGGKLIYPKEFESRIERSIRALFWLVLKSTKPECLPVAVRLMNLYEGLGYSNGRKVYLEKMKKQNLAIVEMILSNESVSGERIINTSGDSLKGGYFVHNCLPYSNGGYAIRTDYLATALNSDSMNLTVFARLGFPTDLSTEYAAEFNDKLINGVRYVYNDSIGRNTHSLRDYLLSSQGYYERIIEEYQLDFVLAASNYITALPVLLAARRKAIPFVYDMRGLWEITRLSREPDFEKSFNYRLQCFAENYIYENADGMSFISKSLQTYVEKRTGFLRSGQTVITRNSADLSKFIRHEKVDSVTLDRTYSKEDGDFVFGYIGSFVVYEGLTLLVKAFHAMLIELGPDYSKRVRLLLVGSDNASSVEDKGPIYREISDYIIDHDLSDRIFLTGRIDAELIPDAYQFLDCCVLPRISSPVTEIVTPLKPVEALASGIPILSSNVGGLREMTAGCKQVRYFAAGNVLSLKEALIDICSLKSSRAFEFFDSDMAKAYAISMFDNRESCFDLNRMISDLVVKNRNA